MEEKESERESQRVSWRQDVGETKRKLEKKQMLAERREDKMGI